MKGTQMSDQKEKNETAKDRIGYGVKPPFIKFEDAIRTVKELARIGGFEGSIDALSKVTGNSINSSNFTYKVRALKNFGLLEMRNDTYALTDVGRQIAQPESPEQEALDIMASFVNSEILFDVWDNYKGKILPQPEYLANYIEKNNEIPPSLSGKWANYFIEAARFAGLLYERESGSYQVFMQPSKQSTDEKPQAETQSAVVSTKLIEEKNQTSSLLVGTAHWGILNQRKLSGDRKAVFAIPDELTQEDIEVLRAMLKGIDAGLDGLKRFDEK